MIFLNVFINEKMDSKLIRESDSLKQWLKLKSRMLEVHRNNYNNLMERERPLKFSFDMREQNKSQTFSRNRVSVDWEIRFAYN